MVNIWFYNLNKFINLRELVKPSQPSLRMVYCLFCQALMELDHRHGPLLLLRYTASISSAGNCPGGPILTPRMNHGAMESWIRAIRIHVQSCH